MEISKTEVQKDFDKYLKISESEDVIIMDNCTPVVRLVGINRTVLFLSDSLVGILPFDIDEEAIKENSLTGKASEN